MKNIKLIFFLFFCQFFSIAQTLEQRTNYTSSLDKNKIATLKKQIILENEKSEKNISKYNFPLTFTDANQSFHQLQGVTESGVPLYFKTNNNGCGTTIRATSLYSGGTLGLNVQGQNMIAGVWDGGATRVDHDHFQGRVIQKDNSTMALSAHATHVTGTICQNKTSAPISRGMAFNSEVWANDWNSDTLEAIDQASQGLLVSNHSYGFGAFNSANELILPVFYFGAYIQTSRNWDLIMNQFPNYLMVTAAGNDRQSQALMTNKGGYDIISGTKTTKNNMVVGAINNMPAYLNASSPVMSGFSSWGPCDDGRIKPDIVAKGVNVVSTTSTGSTSTTTSMSGTSMASPSIAGGLLLLQQHYNNVNGGYMLAATLKGVALHTASEAGSALGPDYQFGWGVLDCDAAARLISTNGISSRIQELTLNPGQTIILNVTATASAVRPFMASICWNDPAGIMNMGIEDSRVPVLVNDLDIKVSKGVVNFLPWVLNPEEPAAPATKGNNVVDPFERVEVLNPSGSYTITISHKGTMAAPQKFSLITSGESNVFSLRSPAIAKNVCSNLTASYELRHITSNAIPTNLSVTGLPAGVVATFTTSSVNSNTSFGLTLSNLGALAVGKYDFQVNGVNGSFANSLGLELNIFSSTFTSIQNQFPLNQAVNLPLITTLNWQRNLNAISYTVELSLNPNFSSIFQTGTSTTNSFTTNLLNTNSDYYWRVKSINNCGQSSFTAIRQFKTINLVCANPTNTVPSVIASTANTIVNSTIEFLNPQVTSIYDLDLQLNITHTYVQDMTLKLTSPDGTVVILQQEACGDENDIDAIYDDSGNAITCSTTSPAISGRVIPFQQLSQFNGQNPNGTWTLTVADPWNGDGGTLNSWKITICSEANLSTASYNLTDDISVYPSPANSFLNFSALNGVKIDKIAVFDSIGKEIKVNISVENQIEVSSFQSGIYFIKFFIGNETVTKKFIKN